MFCSPYILSTFSRLHSSLHKFCVCLSLFLFCFSFRQLSSPLPVFSFFLSLEKVARGLRGENNEPSQTWKHTQEKTARGLCNSVSAQRTAWNAIAQHGGFAVEEVYQAWKAEVKSGARWTRLNHRLLRSFFCFSPSNGFKFEIHLNIRK